jgi:hypothetical protein
MSERPWYVVEHELTDSDGNVVCSMGGALGGLVTIR